MNIELANRYFIVCASIHIILVVYVSSLCADSLINIPLDNEIYAFSDDIYDFVARLAAKGIITDFPGYIFPYSRGEVVRVLIDLSLRSKKGEVRLSAIEKKQLETILTLFSGSSEGAIGTSGRRNMKKPLIEISGDEYQFHAGGGVSQGTISRSGEGFPVNGTVNITALRPSILGQISDSFAFSSDMKWEFHMGDIFPDLFVDESRHSYDNMENIASMQAYGKFKLPWFELELGKDNVRWGPGYHGQLMISDNPQPVDLMKLNARYGRIGLQSFTAKLRSSMGDKYISAHRVEGTIWKGANLAFSEVIVYGDRFETSYMNPFQIYLITEPMIAGPAGTNDNVLAGFDFSCRIVDNLQIYGELAVDDAAPSKEPFNHWDTKFGILAGCYIADPLSISDTDFRMEYAFINQYCYTHEQPINTYKHHSSAMGHWLGSDADNLWCELRHRFTDRIESFLTYELERHGEGGIDKPHPDDAPASDRWGFLSGVTESSHSLSLAISCTKIGYYLFKAKYTHSWLRNVGNSRDVNGMGRQLVLEGCYQF